MEVVYVKNDKSIYDSPWWCFCWND